MNSVFHFFTDFNISLCYYRMVPIIIFNGRINISKYLITIPYGGTLRFFFQFYTSVSVTAVNIFVHKTCFLFNSIYFG